MITQLGICCQESFSRKKRKSLKLSVLLLATESVISDYPIPLTNKCYNKLFTSTTQPYINLFYLISD